MTMSFRHFSLLCLIMAASPAYADSTPPVEHTWLGASQGGLLLASGNTSSTSLNAKLDLSRLDGLWTNTVFFGGLYGKTNGILNGERIEGRYQLNHTINTKTFWFTSVDAVRDQFSGFAYQATVAGGAGRHLIDNDKTDLSVTVGVGYQRLTPEQLVKDSTGAVIQRITETATGNIVGTFGLKYDRVLTASTKLGNKLFVTSGSADTAVTNDLALTVSMNARLALSAGYGVRYNTAPASGVKKLDLLTSINVVYKIQ